MIGFYHGGLINFVSGQKYFNQTDDKYSIGVSLTHRYDKIMYQSEHAYTNLVMIMTHTNNFVELLLLFGTSSLKPAHSRG